MSLCGAETWDLGFGEKTGPALAFPYRDPKTGAKLVGFLRLRLDHPNGTGRYRQTPGSRNHLYIPFAEPEALRDPSRPIILTEGERKALALTAWCERQGRPDVVIGIGGVWSWRRAIKGDLPDGSVGKIGSKPIEDLDLIVWTGRQVVIVFDSDVQQNVDVQRAERGLARELASRGAAVFSTRIPPGPHGVKVGADDLLAERDDTAMTEVLAAAQQAEPPEILIGPDIPAWWTKRNRPYWRPAASTHVAGCWWRCRTSGADGITGSPCLPECRPCFRSTRHDCANSRPNRLGGQSSRRTRISRPCHPSGSPRP